MRLLGHICKTPHKITSNVGDGVTQDYGTALKWYRMAAGQGYADAQANLGVMYMQGLGVSQDYKVAIKWLKLAANQGNVNAQINLGARHALAKRTVIPVFRDEYYLGYLKISFIDDESAAGILYLRNRRISAVPGDEVHLFGVRGTRLA